jgi:hypothetical protein
MRCLLLTPYCLLPAPYCLLLKKQAAAKGKTGTFFASDNFKFDGSSFMFNE